LKHRHPFLAEFDRGGEGPEAGDAVLLARVVGDMGRHRHGQRLKKGDNAESATCGVSFILGTDAFMYEM